MPALFHAGELAEFGELLGFDVDGGGQDVSVGPSTAGVRGTAFVPAGSAARARYRAVAGYLRAAADLTGPRLTSRCASRSAASAASLRVA